MNTKNLNIKIPPQIHKRLKLYATFNNTTIKNVVIEAIEDYLNKRKEESK